MADAICVVAGPLVGQVFPISSRVVRVGRSSRCDIVLQIPAVDEHAVTLQFEGGVCQVYNKSQRPFELDRNSVPPGGSIRWPYHSELVLNGECVLALEQQSTALPTNQLPKASDLLGAPPSDNLSAIASGDRLEGLETLDVGNQETSVVPKSHAVQIGVITVCVAASAVLLVQSATRGPEPKQSVISVTSLFKEIDANLTKTKSKQPDNAELSLIYEDLKAAYLQEENGSKARAASKYDRVLRRLTSRMNRTQTSLEIAKLPVKEKTSKTSTESFNDLSLYLEDPLDRKIFKFASQHRRLVDADMP